MVVARMKMSEQMRRVGLRQVQIPQEDIVCEKQTELKPLKRMKPSYPTAKARGFHGLIL